LGLRRPGEPAGTSIAFHRSVLRRHRAALAASTALLAACGPKWPTVHSLADPAFAGGGPGTAVGTIDILPIDMQVWASPDASKSPDELAGPLHEMVAGQVAARLAERGYEVVAQMDWDGRYVAADGEKHNAMPEPELGAVAYSLSGYGEAQRKVRDGLLVPFLPAKLGQETRSDATLYVGGWAFAGKDGGMSTGAKVALGVFAVAVVAVVVVAAIAGSKDGGGDGVGKVLGGAAQGVGRAAGTAARVAVHAVKPITRLGVRMTAAMVRSGQMMDMTYHVMEAMARTGTHVEIYGGRPDYYRSSAPLKGRSAMLLEMTLVDNRTGRVLWHARQRFPASPAKPVEVEKAVKRLLAALPDAR
jgi:hypothetical protein